MSIDSHFSVELAILFTHNNIRWKWTQYELCMNRTFVLPLFTLYTKRFVHYIYALPTHMWTVPSLFSVFLFCENISPLLENFPVMLEKSRERDSYENLMCSRFLGCVWDGFYVLYALMLYVLGNIKMISRSFGLVWKNVVSVEFCYFMLSDRCYLCISGCLPCTWKHFYSETPEMQNSMMRKTILFWIFWN
jgi:hypothetical protein